MNEIFVAVKEKEYIIAKLTALSDKYNSRQGAGYPQQRALLRNYCHETIVLFEECFETSLLGMKRCLEKVKGFQAKDDIEIGKATRGIFDMLAELRMIVDAMVPIKDLPSCRKLTEFSPEDIISKAKDLVKNDIIKAGVSTLLFGSKIGDIIHIEDIRGFYKDHKSQLEEEIRIKGEGVSPVEQFLMDKFNAEIGYCDIALHKAGIGIYEELKTLADIGRKHIEKYENEWAEKWAEYQTGLNGTQFNRWNCSHYSSVRKK